jgi:hypothetical protein
LLEALSSGKHSEDVAFLTGIGDEDRMTSLDFPIQLNLISDDEVFSTSDIAAALLIGVRPKLLPQKGSQVAPVATLLTDDSGEEIKPAAADDETAPLKDSLINPLGAFSLDASELLQSSLPNQGRKGMAALGRENAIASPKAFRARASLVIVASALLALWGLQEFRTRRRGKPQQISISRSC